MATDDEKLQSALEILNIFPPALKESFEQASGLYNELYPDRPTSVDPSRYKRGDALQAEFARLSQPRPQLEPIGGHIPGNEFSVSVRGLSQGVSSLINSIDAKRREVRLFGDPVRREEITQQISSLDEQAKSLREQAQMFKGGEISTEAMGPTGAPPDEAISKLIADLESQAEQVEAEKATMQEQLQRYQGVAGELSGEQRAVQEAEAEAERNRGFMDDFVRTFGSGMFETTLQTMRDAKSHANAVSIQTMRDNAAKERMILAEAARPKESTERIPNYANTRWIGDYLKNYTGTMQEQRNRFVNEYLLQNPTMGHYDAENDSFILNREMIPEEDLVMINRFDYELRYLEDIELARSFYDDPNFDISQKPPAHHPTQQQKGKIEAMRDELGMPAEFIQAYMYYNNLSYAAPALLPQEARQANQQARPLRFLNENDIMRQRRSEEKDRKSGEEFQRKRSAAGKVGGRDAPAGIGVRRNNGED